jgi:hypothetical protein
MRNVIARVTVVGGHVSVHSEPGAGTRIDGWVPLPDQPTEAGEGEAAAAGEQSADGVSSAGKSASLITSADDTLVGKARDALREALTRYGDAPAAERVRQVLESLDEAPDIEATDAGPPLPPSRRIGILSGWTALRELDALVPERATGHRRGFAPSSARADQLGRTRAGRGGCDRRPPAG